MAGFTRAHGKASARFLGIRQVDEVGVVDRRSLEIDGCPLPSGDCRTQCGAEDFRGSLVQHGNIESAFSV